MSEPRRTFGPVVLLGLASGALAAVAGNQPWAAVDAGAADGVQGAAALASSTDAQMPLAGALGLVVLGAWGVLLVTRGVVRRGVAVLGLVAALGLVATVVVGYASTQEALRSAFGGVGVTDVATAPTGWYWAAAVSAVASLIATALAVRHVASWPAMGSRYDAPGSGRSGPRAGDERAAGGTGDLWRSIDEGHDPTA